MAGNVHIDKAMIARGVAGYERVWKEHEARDDDEPLTFETLVRGALTAALITTPPQPSAEEAQGAVAYDEWRIGDERIKLVAANLQLAADLATSQDNLRMAHLALESAQSRAATPPAPVDVRRFRPALESWKRKRQRSLDNAVSEGKHSGLIAGLRKNVAEADELLALIDAAIAAQREAGEG